MIQTQEYRKKPHFGPNLGLLGPNLSHQLFLKSHIIPVYHPMQFKGKLVNQT